jgi:hypothetical protein
LTVREVMPTDPELQRKIAEIFGVLELNFVYLWMGEGEQLRKAAIRIHDMYKGDASTGKIHQFYAEARLAHAIRGLVRREESMIGLTIGHRELSHLDSGDLGFSFLGRHLEVHEGAKLLQVPLAETPHLPPDCRLLMILGPVDPFRPEEVQRVRDYVRRGGGKVFVALRPGIKTNLEPLLEEWGIHVGVAPIYREGMPRGGIEVSNFMPGHPLNQGYGGTGGFWFPTPCGVTGQTDHKEKPGISATDLFYSGPGSFIEVQVPGPGGAPARQRSEGGPMGFPIAAAAEVESPDRPKSRVVVWGGAQAVVNSWPAVNEPRLVAYFVNTVKWLVEKEEEIVEGRRIEEEPLKLTEGQQRMIMGISLFALPLLGVALGGLAWFFRRK